MSRSSPTSWPNEFRAILRLAIPIAIAQVSLMVMGLVDTACVGRTDPLELAATGTGSALLFAFLLLASGIPMALEPLASQAMGAGENIGAYRWWRKTRRVSAIIGVPFAILTALSAYAMPAFDVSPELASRTADYLWARSPSVVLFLVYLTDRAYLQTVGHTRPLVQAAVVANILNLLANLIFVFGDEGLVSVGLPAVGIPAMGSVGAGIATSVSSLALGFWTLHAIRKLPDAVDAPGIISRMPSVGQLLRLGIPLGLSAGAEVSLFSIVGLLAASLGEVHAGAHQLAIQLAATSFMLVLGFGAAASTRVGQAVGRGDIVGARRAGLAACGLSLLLMLVAMIVFFTIPHLLARAFTHHPETITMAVELLGIAAFFQLADGIQGVLTGALRGTGDVVMPFVAQVVSHWFLGFPAAYYLAFVAEPPLGVHGLWYGLLVGLVSVAVSLAIRFIYVTGRPIKRAGMGPDSANPANPTLSSGDL